jgi:SAM-dependent methyltransferase
MKTSQGMKQLTGYVKQKYGALHAETWQADLRAAFKELWRVLRPGGTLTFKFANNSIPFEDVLDELPEDPMYGTTCNNRNGTQTRWFTFYKPREDSEGVRG